MKKIPILDSMQTNLLDYVDESNEFIKEALDKGKKVLVHWSYFYFILIY